MLEASAKSSILSADACPSSLFAERQRATSVPANALLYRRTLVMAAIASIKAYSRLTLSQGWGDTDGGGRRLWVDRGRACPHRQSPAIGIDRRG